MTPSHWFAGQCLSVPPDFWSVVGQTELDMYVSIAAGGLTRDVDSLMEEFRNHHARVGNSRMWGSVFDTATFVLSRYLIARGSYRSRRPRIGFSMRSVRWRVMRQVHFHRRQEPRRPRPTGR